jgi:predicted amidohydrolase
LKPLNIGLLQGNFRNCFKEKAPEIQNLSNYRNRLSTQDFQFNQKKLLNMITITASRGADIIITPESYLDGWSCNFEVINQTAVFIDDPYVNELQESANKYGVWLCAGLFLRIEEDIFNSAILINSEGSIALIYHKTHETKDVLKQMPYTLGHELSTVQTPWGKIGILICHDRWYGENYRTLRKIGAELVLNPVASATFWPGHPYHNIHSASLRCHTYSNSIFLASCNSTNHGGHSMITAPDGSIAAKAGLEEEILIFHLDESSYDKYNFISNLRPDIYK